MVMHFDDFLRCSLTGRLCDSLDDGAFFEHNSSPVTEPVVFSRAIKTKLTDAVISRRA